MNIQHLLHSPSVKAGVVFVCLCVCGWGGGVNPIDMHWRKMSENHRYNNIIAISWIAAASDLILFHLLVWWSKLGVEDNNTGIWVGMKKRKGVLSSPAHPNIKTKSQAGQIPWLKTFSQTIFIRKENKQTNKHIK